MLKWITQKVFNPLKAGQGQIFQSKGGTKVLCPRFSNVVAPVPNDQFFKPIFLCDAKTLVLGPHVGLNPQREISHWE